jgi:hypothetical protein
MSRNPNHADGPSGKKPPWTPLHQAVAKGTLAEVESIIKAGADLEAVDSCDRTPFLLSVEEGDVAKAAFLFAHGANRHARGHCEKPVTHYPIGRDDVRMMQWLIRQGFEVDLKDEFDDTALKNAVEAGALGCFRVLLEAGANWREPDSFGDPLIRSANHPEIIGTLIELGQDAGKLEPGPLRDLIGLGTLDHLPVTKEEFLKDRTRRFGTANPERMDVPFWHAMVRCGWAGYAAADQFDEGSGDRENPVWSHNRFGMSLTPLEDGRYIQIAGEHEDGYDPDFCIYNDVIVHDGKGGFEILGYPEDVFPPTDFHSATLVGPWIYIIGNLGYSHAREVQSCVTPVFRLDVETYRIERVITKGQSPGWIHKHQAELRDGCIHLSGGEILTLNDDGKSAIRTNETNYVLDLADLTWRPCPQD